MIELESFSGLFRQAIVTGMALLIGSIGVSTCQAATCCVDSPWRPR